MKREPKVLAGPALSKATSLTAFADTLRELGAPVDRGLRRARLPIYYHDRPDAWVSYRAMRNFVSDLCAREALDDLGTRAALRVSDRGVHPELLAAVRAAPTLFSAMRVVSERVKVQSSHLRIWIERRDDAVRLCFKHPLGPAFPGYETIESFSTYVIVSMLRRFCGPAWLPARIITQVASARCRGPDPDTRFAKEGVPLTVHDHYAGFDIPADLLWALNRNRAQPITGPGSIDSPNGVADILRSCLKPYLAEGGQSLELAAEIIGVSKRSLQRKLVEEHMTFSKVVELARLDCALEDIEDPDLPLTEISLRLGYSELSAFSRAFRGWVGMSPRAYRARSGKGGPNAPD